MLDISLKTEFWAVNEEPETGSDNERLFTLVRRKTMANDRDGTKRRPTRFRAVDKNDLVELKQTIEAVLTLLGTDR